MATISKRQLDETLAAFETTVSGADATVKLKDDKLFERLKTFKETTWFAKSDDLSAPVCARYGWINRGLETLYCPTCENTLVCEIPAEASPEEVLAKSKEYRDNLLTAHGESCPWAIHHLDDTAYRLPLSSPAHTIQAFRNRYKALSQHPPSIPKIVFNESQAGRSVNVDLLHQNLHVDGDESEELTRSCILLALFGWEFPNEQATDFLQCRLCARIVGLWNYDHIVTLTDADSADRRKRIKVAQDISVELPSHFDVLWEHRSYCPWICTPPGSGQQKLGWIATLDTVLSAGKPNRLLAHMPPPIPKVTRTTTALESA
ncbi:uncharacterized protein SPPG_03651 [Spizellomyces punctatus DAOM BR117]|uniref:C3HC-type domain-containing protein n=1 Tax=Spizellomyces punctatus (strain DAOM BR117) TaxID=645134 RepID=A0A0L0HK72_SPIPD|nr:uncharacterized protein SPPG_03651 [Spizellomyces punctatus DAOM BR117]KND01861.1 hypothetical protein SPPG_03651 [Spizellomyces punctatus DAOM BR117]|eukprot:XP_016609900.1 hypothetical protein SPPG_03651 [Spizellomyces punctatus DAOM BR117]